MPSIERRCKVFSELDKFGTNIEGQATDGGMGKEDRKRRVLSLLVETNLALPPAVIFRNVKYRGADFERRSVNNYLSELADEGLVIKVDPKSLESGELQKVSMAKEGYFVATDAGVEFIEE